MGLPFTADSTNSTLHADAGSAFGSFNKAAAFRSLSLVDSALFNAVLLKGFLTFLAVAFGLVFVLGFFFDVFVAFFLGVVLAALLVVVFFAVVRPV